MHNWPLLQWERAQLHLSVDCAVGRNSSSAQSGNGKITQLGAEKAWECAGQEHLISKNGKREILIMMQNHKSRFFDWSLWCLMYSRCCSHTRHKVESSRTWHRCPRRCSPASWSPCSPCCLVLAGALLVLRAADLLDLLVLFAPRCCSLCSLISSFLPVYSSLLLSFCSLLLLSCSPCTVSDSQESFNQIWEVKWCFCQFPAITREWNLKHVFLFGKLPLTFRVLLSNDKYTVKKCKNISKRETFSN